VDQQALPAKIVDQLLDKLASDDEFRTLFENDPEAALSRLGHKAPPGSCACMKPRKLADKQTVAATRDDIRELLILGTLSKIPNKLDAEVSQR